MSRRGALSRAPAVAPSRRSVESVFRAARIGSTVRSPQLTVLLQGGRCLSVSYVYRVRVYVPEQRVPFDREI